MVVITGDPVPGVTVIVKITGVLLQAVAFPLFAVAIAVIVAVIPALPGFIAINRSNIAGAACG